MEKAEKSDSGKGGYQIDDRRESSLEPCFPFHPEIEWVQPQYSFSEFGKQHHLPICLPNLLCVYHSYIWLKFFETFALKL